MKRALYQVDAFTDRLFGGNPAGVVVDARGLEDATMQAIAREMNLSETAFVTPPTREGCTHKVRFFTPARELTLCGHATVATFHVLAARGEVSERAVMETGAGEIPIRIDRDAAGGRAPRITMVQKKPSFVAAPFRGVVSQSVGLPPDALAPKPLPEIVSTGAWVAMIPLVSVEVLAHCVPYAEKIAKLGGSRRVDGAYVVVLGAEAGPVSRVRARFFGAEGLGVVEDAVTGTAAGALAGWLAKHHMLAPGAEVTVEQGGECGRPGTVVARVEEDGRASITGSAVTVFETTLDV